VSAKAAIFAALSSSSRLSAIVGSRIYPGLAPQHATLPFVTFQRTDREGVRHLLGPSALARHDFIVAAYAASSVQADEISEAIRLDLDGWSGVAGGVSVDHFTFGRVTDDVDEDDDGGESPVFRIPIELDAWIVEPLA
jgi:hypothetical protein